MDPCSTSKEKETINKMALAKKVLEQCEVLIVDDDKILENTGVKKLRKQMRGPITFNELLHYRDYHAVVRSNLTISQFRHLLKRFYITEKKIPTLKDLTSRGGSEIKKEFALKTLPGLNKGIIVEDPELVYKRMIYLKKMEQIRKANKHMVYIESKRTYFRNTGDYREVASDLFIAVSTTEGLLKAFFFSANENNTAKWVLDSISTLNGPCVVVMEEQDDDIPTSSSLKSEMSSWLTTNGIPHDPKAHRGEMYELIKKIKDNGNFTQSKIDEVIIALGHEVVRYPKYMEELNFFRMLQDLKLKDLPKQTRQDPNTENSGTTTSKKWSKISFIRSIDLSKWQQFERELIDNEWLMLKEDMIMEKIIDNLCTMVADGAAPELQDSLVEVADWKKIASAIIID